MRKLYEGGAKDATELFRRDREKGAADLGRSIPRVDRLIRGSLLAGDSAGGSLALILHLLRFTESIASLAVSVRHFFFFSINN